MKSLVSIQFPKSIMFIKSLMMALALLSIISLHEAHSAEVEKHTFIVWGDSQLTHPELFARVVRETELLRPEFVVQVGDLIHGYTYDQRRAEKEWDIFKRQIAPLSAPYYPVPGNHDITTKEIDAMFGMAMNRPKPYYYSFDHESIHFIILSSYEDQAADVIGPEQEAWLRADLEAHKGARHIFVALHTPFHMGKETEKWDHIHEALTQYPVRAVFTGHSHVYDYEVRDGIHYFCLNSAGRMAYATANAYTGYTRGYLIVSVEGDTPHFAWASLEDGIHPPDFVAERGHRHASPHMEADLTILIPDPAKGPVFVEVEAPITNNANMPRDYTLTWESDDFRWTFEPRGAQLNGIDPKETIPVAFSIRGPRGDFKRGDLPRLRVDSPYVSPTGHETTLTYYCYLFFLPETSARPLKGDFKFDGKTGDKAWSDLPAITRLFTDENGTSAPEQTIVKVAYDKDNIYVAVNGEEPNPGGLAAFAHGSLPLVFGDDDFELFFDTNRDLKTFFRLMTNSKGTKFCSSPKGLFTFEYDVETHVGKDFWSAEFRIPFSELEIPAPRPGDVWGFNVRRHRQQADPPQRDWSKMQNVPYQPAYFGLLRFE